MAARSPARPPPTIRMSWAATTAPSFTPELLVEDHSAVVVDDLVVDAAVVELLVVRLAPAREAQVSCRQALQVLGDELVAVLHAAARRGPRLEPSRGGRHGAPPAPGRENAPLPTYRLPDAARNGKGSRGAPVLSPSARPRRSGPWRAPAAAWGRRSPGARPSPAGPPATRRPSR